MFCTPLSCYNRPCARRSCVVLTIWTFEEEKRKKLCIISIVFFCVLCSTSVWDITSGVVYMAFQKMRMKYFLERPPSVKIWNFLYSYALEIWFSHLKWILGSSSFMNIKYMTIFRFFHFSLEIFVFELHLSIRDQDWQFLREALLKYSSSGTKKNGH